MAADLGSAYFQLVPSMRGFQGTISKQFAGIGINEGRAVGNRFTSGLSSVVGGSAIAGVFAGIAATATQAIGGAVSSAFRAAGASIIGFNSQLENAQIAFTTMLGSGTKAQSFLADLKTFAKSTPFEFPDLVTASQRLIAMGISAKDVIPYMTGIGDAVAGLGGGADKIDQVVTAIGQISAKGKVQGDEILQLTEAGIPALRILADSYGVSTSKISDMISAGDVLASKALPALITGFEKGTKSVKGFGGLMAQQSLTFTGALSNVKDATQQTLATAFKPFFDAASKGMQALATALSDPRVANFATNFAAGLQIVINRFDAAKTALSQFFAGFNVGDAANFVNRAAESFTPLFKVGAQTREVFETARNVIAQFYYGLTLPASAVSSLSAFLTPVEQIGLTVQSSFNTARQAVDDFFTGFTKGTDALGSVQTTAAAFGAAVYGTFASLGPVFQPLVQAFAALGPVVLQAVQNLSPLSVLFQTLGPVIPQIVQVIAQLASIVGTVLAQALAIVIPFVTQIVGVLSGTLIQIMPVVIQLVGAVGSALSTLVPAILGLLGPILQLVGTLVQQLAPIFVQLVNAILPEIITTLGLVVAAITPLIQTITSVLIPIIQALLPVITAVFGAIVPIIQGALQIVVGVIQVVTGIITGNWKQVWSGLANIVGGAFNTIVAVIRGAVGIVGAAIKFVLDAGVAIFKGAVKFFADAGRSIIDAIAGGIRDRVKVLGDAVGSVMNFIKGFFPHSPAKRGPFSGSGWTRVAKSGAALADQFAAGFNNGATDFASTIGGITPAGLTSSMTASIDGAKSGGAAVLINNKTNVRLEDLIDVRIARGDDADSRAVRMGYQPLVFG